MLKCLYSHYNTVDSRDPDLDVYNAVFLHVRLDGVTGSLVAAVLAYNDREPVTFWPVPGNNFNKYENILINYLIPYIKYNLVLFY